MWKGFNEGGIKPPWHNFDHLQSLERMRKLFLEKKGLNPSLSDVDIYALCNSGLSVRFVVGRPGSNSLVESYQITASLLGALGSRNSVEKNRSAHLCT